VIAMRAERTGADPGPRHRAPDRGRPPDGGAAEGFDRNGHAVAVTAGGGTVRVRYVPDDRPVFTVHNAGDAGRVALSPDGRLLAVARTDGTLGLWRIP
jgi:hypothetical protein